MKNKLLLLVFGLVMTTQIIFAQVPSYVPTNGLVGYWPFNGNANDQSGNGNNGTVNGATLTTDRFGNNNSAYSFNGINNYIETLSNNFPINNSARTISLWYFYEPFQSMEDWSSLFSYGSSNNTPSDNRKLNDIFVAYPTNRVYFNANELGTIANASQSLVNNWRNITIVYGGTDISTLKIYLDGLLLSSQIINSTQFNELLTNISNLNIGKTSSNYIGNTGANGTNFYYKGKIDDIGIWNRALSQQEITSMFNGVNYSDTCNAVSGSLVNGLVAYYPFCGNANDQSGNGNNGLVNEATLTTDRFGNANSAYSFDGVNDFISCLNNNIPMGNSSRTFSAWFYLTPTSGYSDGYSLISYGTNSFPDGRLNDVNINQNGIWYNAHQYYASTLSSVNNTNSWNNLVVTYDNTNISNIKIYFNGLLIPTTNYNIGNVSILNTLNTNVQFGKAINQYASYFYFNGKIDDIGIWNRALTQEEITQLYNQNQCITNITVTDTLIINVGQMSHTNPVAYANNITIYPNPASTQININFNNITDLTGGTIKIINSLGQQVATTPITLTGSSTSMALGSWGGNGVYFVQIINAQGQIVDIKKIILQ